MNSEVKQMPRWMVALMGIIFMMVSFFMIKGDIDTQNSMNSYTYSKRVSFETIHKRKNGKTKKTYRPVYHYNVGGAEYSCESRSSSSFKSSINKKIYYESAAPRNCFVAIGIEDVFFNGLFFIFGLLVVIYGIKGNKNSYGG